MGSTLAESANEDKKRFAEGAGKITYSLVRNDFYVISGTSGDQTFYNNTAFANGKFSAVELTYPTAESARWNPIVARESASVSSPTKPAGVAAAEADALFGVGYKLLAVGGGLGLEPRPPPAIRCVPLPPTSGVRFAT